MLKKFIIHENEYLRRETVGYYNRDFTRFRNPGNPDFLNYFKNNYLQEDHLVKEASEQVTCILIDDIRFIMQEHMPSCLCVNVPRAKIPAYYQKTQLMLLASIQNAIRALIHEFEQKGTYLKIVDGTDCIIRTIDTKTTHLRNPRLGFKNEGDKPFVGITKKTCAINSGKISGQNVILVDDIYTAGVNIDEDCIQALYDNGAKNVIFYAIGKTTDRWGKL